MLFLSLLFVLFQAYSLIKGKLFYDLQLESAKWQVKVKRGEATEVPQEINIQTGILGFFGLLILIFQIILVVNALTFDPFLYPTIGFIILWFLNFVTNVGKSKKKNLDVEVGIAKFLASASKRRTFKGFILSLIYFVYYTYLFLVILKVI